MRYEFKIYVLWKEVNCYCHFQRNESVALIKKVLFFYSISKWAMVIPVESTQSISERMQSHSSFAVVTLVIWKSLTNIVIKHLCWKAYSCIREAAFRHLFLSQHWNILQNIPFRFCVKEVKDTHKSQSLDKWKTEKLPTRQYNNKRQHFINNSTKYINFPKINKNHSNWIIFYEGCSREMKKKKKKK